MSYRNIDIWKLSKELVIEIHQMTLQLPKFELYEEGQQIRRSMKSVKSTIVEGYGRRRYKNEFMRYLVFAHASTDGTIDHLETLFKTSSLTNETLFNDLKQKLQKLSKMLYSFIQSVESEHISPK